MPSIFVRIASLLKDHYDGKRTQELCPELPPGVVKYGETYVRSEPIRREGHTDTCSITGRFDIVVEFDDGTYGVIDFKTGNPRKEYARFYSRQLHAYAYALEHPAPGFLGLFPVSKLGLLYFHPSKTSQVSTDWLSYDAEIHWIEVVKDEEGFLGFVDEVLNVLESPEVPPPSPGCQWCDYVNRLSGLSEL